MWYNVTHAGLIRAHDTLAVVSGDKLCCPPRVRATEYQPHGGLTGLMGKLCDQVKLEGYWVKQKETGFFTAGLPRNLVGQRVVTL